MKEFANFAGLLEAFFTERLMNQRQASPHTIASYRDTFRLLLEFAQQHLKKSPSTLTLEDIDAPFVGSFLDHLEKNRSNTARSRNVRLAAIHSFFKYIALYKPEYSGLIQRVLAMPGKRYDRTQVEFLTHQEIETLLASPDLSTWSGRRDRTLMLVAVQTGLRVSELVGLRRDDVVLSKGAHIRCRGKGRKERCIPLRKETISALHNWFRERNGQDEDFLFPNARGYQLSSDGIEYLLAKHVAVAREQCSSMRRKRISPHVLRHSTAMELLQHGVDHSVIALWLGHESPETTQMYIHANMELKEQALAKTSSLNIRTGRYRPDDKLLAFLKSL